MQLSFYSIRIKAHNSRQEKEKSLNLITACLILKKKINKTNQLIHKQMSGKAELIY